MSSSQVSENSNSSEKDVDTAMSSSPNNPSTSISIPWDEGDLILQGFEDEMAILAKWDDPQQTVKVDKWKLLRIPWEDEDDEASFFRKTSVSYKWGKAEPYYDSDYRGYIRWDESQLDAEFGKYKIGDADENELATLIETMKEGKVQPTNVVCLALGTLHAQHPWSREWSFGQLSALLKFIELLGILSNAKKLIQDPAMTPGDEIFFRKFGFQAVADPEGINAIDEGTLLFFIHGMDEITERIMDRPPPAMFISDRSLAVRMHQKRSVRQKMRETLAMKNLFASQRIPRIRGWRGMWGINLYWRRAAKRKTLKGKFIGAGVKIALACLGKKNGGEFVVGEPGELNPAMENSE
ncbi:hypothetical protein OCU04_010606 [Sclerotinia nivalis]|uniref:SRR1-like domain-containing protein n=1 Tax=Sclerotinia nivalis TaxID=352851 RepID=A0A9X0ACL2_9HELO|nr:hypothetical protein OCU04_010606 [Sclerotinia nivalis]